MSVTIDAPANLPPLPAAVEVAAYRIACEAMTNIARHAEAHSCHIALTLGHDALRMEISDDGVGLASERQVGVGLVSMRERAEELGGTCAILSWPRQWHAHCGTCYHSPRSNLVDRQYRQHEDSLRVLIADDHPIFRDGIRALLASVPDFEIAGEAATGEEAIAEAADIAARCGAHGSSDAGNRRCRGDTTDSLRQPPHPCADRHNVRR